MAFSCFQGSQPCVTNLFLKRTFQSGTKFISCRSSRNNKHEDNDLVRACRHYSARSSNGICLAATTRARMTSVFVSRLAGDIHVLPQTLKFATALSASYQSRGVTTRSKASASRYYDVLGLSPKATQKQIKSAYYNMSKLYHPDVAKGDRSHALFTEINEAYEVLGNLRKRRMYDRGIYTRDSSLHSASDVDEDYTQAYRSKQSPFERGDRPPPPRGRTNVYNFDEFYRQHYNDIRERRANEYKEFVQHQETMQRKGRAAGQAGYHQGPGQSLFLTISVLILLISLAISRENYDRDLIGSNRMGASHPNYYGGVGPLGRIPLPKEGEDEEKE